jgi:hypothetical protein
MEAYYELTCKSDDGAKSVNLLEKNVKLTLSQHEFETSDMKYRKSDNLLQNFELIVTPIDLKQFAGVKSELLDLIPEHEYICEVEAWTNTQDKAFLWAMSNDGKLLDITNLSANHKQVLKKDGKDGNKIFLSANQGDAKRLFKLYYDGDNSVKARFGIFFKNAEPCTKLFIKSFKVLTKNCGCYKPRKIRKGKWWPYEPTEEGKVVAKEAAVEAAEIETVEYEESDD